MRVRFFTIPAFEPAEAEAELNAFLANHRVSTVDRQFVAQGECSHWLLAVTTVDATTRAAAAPPSFGAAGRRPRVDYREKLSEPEFAVYARLRDLRKVRVTKARNGCFAAARGTRTRGTAGRRTATRTTPATATRTSGSASPERRRGLDDPPLTRPSSGSRRSPVRRKESGRRRAGRPMSGCPVERSPALFFAVPSPP